MNLTVVAAERALEVCFLLIAPYQIWRFIFLSPFRKKSPIKAFILVAVLAFYSVSVLVISLIEPWVLRSLVVLIGSGLIFVWWRGRPKYGKRRGWPPGRLTILPLGPCLDPGFFRKEAERFGRVFKTGATHPYPTLRPVACIVGNELGFEVLKRYDAALTLRPELPFSRFIARGFLRHMEPADHAQYSKLFHAAMQHAVTNYPANIIVAAIRARLLLLSHDCAGREAKGIRPDRHLKEMLFAIMTTVFYGISPNTPRFEQLRNLHDALGFHRVSKLTRPKKIEASRAELMAFLIDQAKRVHHDKTNDPVLRACALAAVGQIQERNIDDPTVIGNFAYMLEVSRNDVAGLLMWLLKMLADNPAWMNELRKGSTALPTSDSLAGLIVQEALRLEQSEYLYRHTTRDIKVAGYTIPKGWVLRICTRDAHRDPSVFQNPCRFDPRRFEKTNQLSPTAYAPFGLFRHKCIGADLTNMIGRMFVHELAHGFNLFTVDDGPPELLKYHWEPNAGFRIRLETRP